MNKIHKTKKEKKISKIHHVSVALLLWVIPKPKKKKKEDFKL